MTLLQSSVSHHFTIEASSFDRRPATCSVTARSLKARATASSVPISATTKRLYWKRPIGRPKACRCLQYSSVCSKTHSAAARAAVPIAIRSRGRFCIRATKPPPSSPSIFPAGTRTSLKKSSEVSWAWHADLLQVPPAFEAGHTALDHEQADALVAGLRIGACHHDHQIAHLAVGDERLLAVQDVVVAVPHRGRADALQVAARAWLAHRDGGDELTGAVAGQPAFALLGTGQAEQVLPVDVVVHGEARAMRAGPGQLLVHDQVVRVVGVPAAAVLLVDIDPEKASPPGREPDLTRDRAIAFPLLVIGRDLPGDEGTDHVPERVVLAGEDIPLHPRLPDPSASAGERNIASRVAGRAGCLAGRALAHPERISILQHLVIDGPATATACEQVAGLSPSACSYHLRALARYGFIKEDPASAADGRHRPWRASVLAISFGQDPDQPDAVQAAGRLLAASLQARIGEVRAHYIERESDSSPAWGDPPGLAP